MAQRGEAGDGDLAGRVFVVTGANAGIGLATTAALASRGAHVVLACRSPERAEAAIAQVRAHTPRGELEVLRLDLGSLASVRESAAAFLARGLPLHGLINNAGLPGKRGQTTSDGFELAFGVNHIGHFLFTQRLLDRLRESAPSRVVTVASHGHYRARGLPFDRLREPTRTLTGFDEYCVSKLANVLFSAELGRRLEGTGVTTYSLHPGPVASDIWRDVPWPIRPLMKLFMISNEAGAKTSLHCATEAGPAAETGLYYDRCRPRTPSRLGRDQALAGALWERTEGWIAEASGPA